MKSDTMYRKLRELDVPAEKARAAATKYGDEANLPNATEEQRKAIARAARRKQQEQHRREFRVWCAGNRLPLPVHEHPFAVESHGRNWRFDWAWPDPDGAGVALEIEGGVFSRGRHTRPRGYIEDAKKYSTAAALGWKVVRVTPQSLFSEDTLALLKAALEART